MACRPFFSAHLVNAAAFFFLRSRVSFLPVLRRVVFPPRFCPIWFGKETTRMMVINGVISSQLCRPLASFLLVPLSEGEQTRPRFDISSLPLLVLRGATMRKPQIRDRFGRAFRRVPLLPFPLGVDPIHLKDARSCPPPTARALSGEIESRGAESYTSLTEGQRREHVGHARCVSVRPELASSSEHGSQLNADTAFVSNM